MRGEPLNNFGQLSRPMTGSTSFPLSTDLSVIKRHIKEKTSESIDEYCVRYCHVRNLSIVNKKISLSTKVLLSRIDLEFPVFKPWMDKWFKEDVTSDKVEAMAWLIGFWIGNGYKRGAIFALHSEYHDVHDYLRSSAEKLDMIYRFKKRGEDGFKAEATLLMPDGSRDKNSLLITALEDLRFYQHGTRDDPKNVPEFLRFETRSVREYFMAGLIDSDGSTKYQQETVRACI